MAMVDVVFQLPTGGPVARVRRLRLKVSSHLMLFCIHRMSQVT